MRSVALIWLLLLVVSARAWAASGGQEADERFPHMNAATLEAMLQVLKGDSAFARMKAATALGDARVDDRSALKALAGMLSDDYAPARASALYALGRSRAPAAASLAASLLEDPDALVRAEACRAVAALAAHGQADKLPLEDDEPLVRQAALAAAARIGKGRLESRLAARFGAEDEPDLQAACLRTLRQLAAPEGCAIALQGLRSGDTGVQTEALRWLAAVDHPDRSGARSRVRKLLSSPSARVRCAALRACTAIEGEAAQDKIVQHLADRDHTVRRTAALMLGRVATAACRPALVRLQSDAVREVRRAASVALVEHRMRDANETPAIEALAVAATRSDNPAAQREGLWMLGEMRSKAGFPGVLDLGIKGLPNMLKEREMKAFAEKEAPDYRASALVMWLIARTAHAPGGALAMNYVLAPSQALRIHGARALGTIPYEPARGLLANTVLKTKSIMGEVFFVYTGRERTVALWALAEMGGPAVLDTFTRLAGMTRPVDTAENLRLVCEVLVREKHKTAARGMRRAIKNQRVAGTEQAVVLADTVQQLTGETVEADVPNRGPHAGRFFLNVREK